MPQAHFLRQSNTRGLRSLLLQQGELMLRYNSTWWHAKRVWFQSTIGKISPGRFARFALVGASGVVVNLAAFALLSNAVGLRDWRASALASLGANLSNYFFNNMWTYVDRAHRRWALVRGYFSYLLMSLIGLAVSTVTYATLARSFKYFSPFGTIHSGSSTILFCQLAGVLAGTVFNYALNQRITWRVKGPVGTGFDLTPAPLTNQARRRSVEGGASIT